MFMGGPVIAGIHHPCRKIRSGQQCISSRAPLPYSPNPKGRARPAGGEDAPPRERRMKALTTGLLLAMLLGGVAAANENLMKELAPTGKLRVALVFAPSKSVFFVVKEADGKPQGVTAEIADALGKKLSLPVEF